MIQFFLFKGVDVLRQDSSSVIVFYFVVEIGQLEFVSMILVVGGRVDDVDYFGYMVIFKVVQGGSLEVFWLLLEYNVDLNVCDIWGDIFLYLVVKIGVEKLVLLLFDYGVEVDVLGGIDVFLMMGFIVGVLL